MKFEWMSDSIRLHQQPHHYPWDDGDASYGTKFSPARLHHRATDSHDDAGDISGSSFGSPSDASVTPSNSTSDGGTGVPGKADIHQPTQAQAGGNGGGGNAADGGSSAHQSNSGKSDTGTIDTGANDAGNGGDGFFYGGIIHASLVIYQPINIAISVGYGSIAIAEQTNDVTIDQSALQMAGIGGDGGDGNMAAGGNVDVSSSGSNDITTGDNHAGNGGDGYFLGTLLNAPVVIYHPVNFAFAGPGGTAHAGQSNTVEIDQSAVQIAGVGGQGGNGNAASGGDVSVHGQSSGGGSGANQIDTGGNQAGNGGDGQFHGDLVHKSVAVYDPVNISVAGYNSTSQSYQLNDVHLDQSSFQMAGTGGDGGSGNIAAGGGAAIISALLGGGSDAIATGHNSAGNGGSGHFSGSLIDVNVAIYAPINIAIAGPHSTAEADQINNVHIDQSTVQIAGIGGNGGHGNLALGGDVAMHLLSDLHLIG